jgi:hypothetical protein
MLCLVAAGGIASAGDAPIFAAAMQNAAHETERDLNGDGEAAKLQQLLEEIIKRQKQVREGILNDPNRHPHPPRSPREPTIGETPVVVLKKGESATVSHTIRWNQYKFDDLEVTVTTSDRSLVVPEKLALNFESHQFRFQYEIKAGEKDGEFTVTLTPTVGNIVVVKVLVK